jgi:hypothetical protein
MSIRLRYGALLVFTALVVFYPFKVTVVPPWRIQVVDTSGKPVSNMRVAQEWQHYSIEREGHSEESVTDEGGFVTFPERVESASLYQRFIVGVGNVPWVLHTSWGPHSFILVLAGPDYLNDAVSYNGKEPPPSSVILRRMNEIPPLKE